MTRKGQTLQRINVEKIRFVFDVTSLETPATPGAKVNLDVGKLDNYKKEFVKKVGEAIEQGAEEIVITGAGPAWVHAALWHEAHGRVPDGQIFYQAPGIEYAPIAAGTTTGDGGAVKNGQVIVDISKFENPDPTTGRVNLDFKKVNDYQRRVLGMLPAFKVGEEMPEFEVVLTGAGPVWLFLALVAACHSRGGTVVYSAPNCPRCVIVDHK